MKLTRLTPMIWTENFAETISFYSNILGFHTAALDEEMSWAALQKDEVEIMVSKPNEHIPFEKPVFTGTFYFVTNDAHGMWQHVKDK